MGIRLAYVETPWSNWQLWTCYRVFGDWDKFLVNGWRDPLPVNPDRHARIRAKHFVHAYGKLVSAAYREHHLSGGGGLWQMGDDWYAGYLNSAWGCS